MQDQGDKSKKANGRGGSRKAGPGKRMGRPTKAEAHAMAQARALVPVPMSPDRVLQPIIRPAYEQIRALEQGESPVDILLTLARAHMADFLREAGKRKPKTELKHAYAAMAREAAARAARYCHPALSAVRHSGTVGSVTWNMDMLMAVAAKLPEGELDNFERLFRLIATAAPGPEGIDASPAAPGAAGDSVAAPAPTG